MPKKFHICFASPPGFQHSGAFFEVAELILYALRELGCEVTLAKNAIDPNARNILIGIHLMDQNSAKDMPPGTIILNTEQLGSVYETWNERILGWFSQDFTLWDYSDTNIAALKNFGVGRVEKLQIGFQKELCRIPARAAKDVDVLFYGAINQRRRTFLEDLHSRGLRVKHLNGTYGSDRDAWIARSRMVLNLHFYDSQIFEIVRAFYLMTNGIPLASEINPGTQIDDCYRNGLLGLPYEELADGIVEILQDKGELAKLAAKAKETMARLPQAVLLDEIL